jgi:hypothetical protein
MDLAQHGIALWMGLDVVERQSCRGHDPLPFKPCSEAGAWGGKALASRSEPQNGAVKHHLALALGLGHRPAPQL